MPSALSSVKTRQRVQREKAFQAEVERKAQMLGWYTWHCYDPRRSGKGFPDLLLLKDRALWFELKAYYDNGRAGRVMPEQTNFHQMLRDAGQEVYVFFDDEDGWREIMRLLSDGRLT